MEVKDLFPDTESNKNCRRVLHTCGANAIQEIFTKIILALQFKSNYAAGNTWLTLHLFSCPFWPVSLPGMC